MIELLVRLAISMAVVMAVMGLAARYVRRRQDVGSRTRGRATSQRPLGGKPGGAVGKLGGLLGGARSARPGRARNVRPAPPIEVVYRRAVAKNAALAVVEATGKQYLIGITEQSVTLLTELPTPGSATPSEPATWSEFAARSEAGAAAFAPSNGPSNASGPSQATVRLDNARPGGPGPGGPGPGGPGPGGPGPGGAGESAIHMSDLEDWQEFEDWKQADRMSASQPDVASLERQNAWKLTLESLRERTIRR